MDGCDLIECARYLTDIRWVAHHAVERDGLQIRQAAAYQRDEGQRRNRMADYVEKCPVPSHRAIDAHENHRMDRLAQRPVKLRDAAPHGRRVTLGFQKHDEGSHDLIGAPHDQDVAAGHARTRGFQERIAAQSQFGRQPDESRPLIRLPGLENRKRIGRIATGRALHSQESLLQTRERYVILFVDCIAIRVRSIHGSPKRNDFVVQSLLRRELSVRHGSAVCERMPGKNRLHGETDDNPAPTSQTDYGFLSRAGECLTARPRERKRGQCSIRILMQKSADATVHDDAVTGIVGGPAPRFAARAISDTIGSFEPTRPSPEQQAEVSIDEAQA
ncbi:hypothetical protein [Paraburkholderia piptadeniae]|uniref:hypothetical protein n=1 Tax=Paraburkholderia piptadeniae TaxID=1701573 RepID=UPI00117F70FD|nr:hypothetical protein [Paraburkholderia piptadeniae]